MICGLPNFFERHDFFFVSFVEENGCVVWVWVAESAPGSIVEAGKTGEKTSAAPQGRSQRKRAPGLIELLVDLSPLFFVLRTQYSSTSPSPSFFHGAARKRFHSCIIVVCGT